MKCFKMRDSLAVTIFVISASSLSRVCGGQIPTSSKDASILSEARYLHNNGQFGSAYTQDDGVEFKEESDANGDRRGSYSYIDPAGRRRTVTYTAGKDGFRASGDDIPPMPMTAAASAMVAQSTAGDYDEPQYDEPAPGRMNLKRPAKFNAPRYDINVPLASAPRSDNFNNNNNNGRAPQPHFLSGQSAPQSRHDIASDYNNNSDQPASDPSRDNLGATFNHMPRHSQTNNNINPGAAPAQFNTIRFQYQSPSVATRNNVQPDSSGEPVPSRRYFSPGKYSLSRSPDGYTYTFSKD